MYSSSSALINQLNKIKCIKNHVKSYYDVKGISNSLLAALQTHLLKIYEKSTFTILKINQINVFSRRTRLILKDLSVSSLHEPQINQISSFLCKTQRINCCLCYVFLYSSLTDLLIPYSTITKLGIQAIADNCKHIRRLNVAYTSLDSRNKDFDPLLNKTNSSLKASITLV